MVWFSSPESALKRAQELIGVGDSDSALQTLHDLISHKRHRTWSKALEEIMFLFVELCVEKRNKEMVKDGLIQFRMACQAVNSSSLDKVVRHLIAKSAEAMESARAKSKGADAADADKQAALAVQAALMGAVSLEDAGDRVERELVTPMIRFMWESFRIVLDLLRYNNKLERVYCEVATSGFEFCRTNKRATEFRRLCDILRTHLAHQGKQTHLLNEPESLAVALETRFVQLKVAAELEMWQEAYRTIEDLSGLMALSKDPPVEQVLGYYRQLATIFFMAKNHLFHALAWSKVCKLSDAPSPDDETKLLLAVLCVQPDDNANAAHPSLSSANDKSRRMAQLLGFAAAPTRKALLAEAIAFGVLRRASSDAVALYKTLERGFSPLTLGTAAKPLIDAIAAAGTHAAYAPALEDAVLLRTLVQAGRVFRTMRSDKLAALVPWLAPARLEAFMVKAVKAGYVALTINHKTSSVTFGSDAVQPRALTQLGVRLTKIVTAMNPVSPADREQRRLANLASIKARLDAEHAAALKRQREIAERKAKKMAVEKARREAAAAEAKRLAKQRREEERIKMEYEAKKLEEEKARREREEKDRLQVKMLKEEIEKANKGKKKKKKKKKGKGAAAPVVSGAPESTEAERTRLLQERKDQIAQAKETAEQKKVAMAKRINFMERAMREVERPRLREAYEKQKIDDREAFVRHQTTFVKEHAEEHKRRLEQKQKWAVMQDDRAAFVEQVMAKRRTDHTKAVEAQKVRMAAKQARREERARKRKEKEEKERAEREEADRIARELAEAERAQRIADGVFEQGSETTNWRDMHVQRGEGTSAGGAGGDRPSGGGGGWRTGGASEGKTDWRTGGGGASGGAAAGGAAAAGGGDGAAAGGGGGWRRGGDAGGDRPSGGGGGWRSRSAEGGDGAAAGGGGGGGGGWRRGDDAAGASGGGGGGGGWRSRAAEGGSSGSGGGGGSDWRSQARAESSLAKPDAGAGGDAAKEASSGASKWRTAGASSGGGAAGGGWRRAGGEKKEDAAAETGGAAPAASSGGSSGGGGGWRTAGGGGGSGGGGGGWRSRNTESSVGGSGGGDRPRWGANRGGDRDGGSGGGGGGGGWRSGGGGGGGGGGWRSGGGGGGGGDRSGGGGGGWRSRNTESSEGGSGGGDRPRWGANRGGDRDGGSGGGGGSGWRGGGGGGDRDGGSGGGGGWRRGGGGGGGGDAGGDRPRWGANRGGDRDGGSGGGDRPRWGANRGGDRDGGSSGGGGGSWRK